MAKAKPKPKTRKLEWHEVVEAIKPFLVRIQSPGGSGTGFLWSYHGEDRIPGISTAYHVIDDADTWQQPIKIWKDDKAVLLQAKDRVVTMESDAASIWVTESGTELIGALGLPEAPVPLLPKPRHVKVGVEVGWLGFPWGISSPCFFSGKISDHDSSDGISTYFIDGNAINGVSGGPVLVPASLQEGERYCVIGSITQYIPNRQGEETLPGLSVALGASGLSNLAPPQGT